MKRVGQHILFWSIFVLWSSFLFECPSTYLDVVWYNVMRLPIIVLATYVLIYFIVPRYIVKSQDYFTFSILFLINFIMATLLDRAITFSVILDFCFNPSTSSFFSQVPLLRNSFLLLSVMGLASMIRFFKLYLEKERKGHQLQKDHLETKLSFLKAQVSPHFLFNALNNLYSMSIQKEEKEIAAGLENLSGIMHYLTYESNDKLVSLQKEMELLRNYIEIQQLRIADTDDTTISFNLEGKLNGQQIAPVLLLPLVENAFKHGVQPNKKCLVSIKIKVKKDELDLKIQNTKFAAINCDDKNNGVGLKNVQRRLSLVYPQKHTLQANEDEEFYFTTLKLDLK